MIAKPHLKHASKDKKRFVTSSTHQRAINRVTENKEARIECVQSYARKKFQIKFLKSFKTRDDKKEKTSNLTNITNIKPRRRVSLPPMTPCHLGIAPRRGKKVPSQCRVSGALCLSALFLIVHLRAKEESTKHEK